MSYVEFERDVREGLVRAGRLAGTVAVRNDRRTRKGAPMATLILSDPSGSYEVVAFSEQILQFGKLLEVGKSVILSLEADQRPDGLGLRLLSAEPIEGAAEKVGKSLEIEVDNEKALAPIKAQLKRGGNGRITFVVAREQGRRVHEVDVGTGFIISAALAGAIKATPGVVDVRYGS
jgi:DNA polymerase-3 subunit alpha